MSDLATSPAAVPGRAHSPVGDTLVMIRRAVRLSRRNIDALLTAVLLPAMIMLLFVYLFGGAIRTSTEYVNYALPGVLVLCTGFVSAQTAVAVTQDLQEGIVDRFRSMDIGGAAILAGHVAASVVRTVWAGVVMLAVALLIGFRPDANAFEWLAALGIVQLFVLAVSWLAAVFGLLSRTPEGANGFAFFLMFLPYPSSAFVPIETMPGWLRPIAEHQPVTPVIETLRGLLIGMPGTDRAGVAVLWCTGIVLAAVAVAAVLFRRRTS
ncbi:ABC-2 type transport system permease protein [Prauserella shujinwangii]|uniref:Transport permease protein n=1 Tax=Prauserella shujinwangii TaxID=1453103 RepID=A0A2T0LWI7_9PSEU|nr:ABC transporter permease [Prauserella shujinwangii]PRX48329.1 ABC-2 type transport system permease protein [Prauserella shujinwangii]